MALGADLHLTDSEGRTALHLGAPCAAFDALCCLFAAVWCAGSSAHAAERSRASCLTLYAAPPLPPPPPPVLRPRFAAAGCGDKAMALRLVDLGTDVNCKDSVGGEWGQDRERNTPHPV